MKIVDLFSGIGGFSYAAEQIVGGFETIAFVERDEYCQKVLRKHWSDVPIYSDIRSFNGKEYKDADIVVGGFPCQPWSVAGAQRGSEDDRDLWHEMVRVIEDIRPRWIIGENVSGFVTMPMGLRRSLIDLESIGYKAIPYLIPAAAVDAKHRRMRCWIVGYSEHDGSSAPTFRRGNEQIDGGSSQGQNQTSKLEGASGQQDNGYVQTNIFDLMADTENGRGKQTEWQGGKGFRGRSENIVRSETERKETDKTDVADTNNTGDRTPASGVDTEQQTIKQGREQQSQSELSRQREDVENANSSECQARSEEQGALRESEERRIKCNNISGRSEDVSNTKSKRLEGRIHSTTIGEERNESTHSRDIHSRERDNVANTDNKGVRTRINGSDNDLQKEGGSWRDDRTTSRTDVGLHAQTSKNGEMELSQKGDVPYTIGKRRCSGSSRGEDAKDVRQSSFRERPVLWDAEPNVGRVANGVSNRVHRLRCLGNSIVPQVVARIFYSIKEAENDRKI
jgi:DNA-cytosine methyltransferase